MPLMVKTFEYPGNPKTEKLPPPLCVFITAPGVVCAT